MTAISVLRSPRFSMRSFCSFSRLIACANVPILFQRPVDSLRSFDSRPASANAVGQRALRRMSVAVSCISHYSVGAKYPPSTTFQDAASDDTEPPSTPEAAQRALTPSPVLIGKYMGSLPDAAPSPDAFMGNGTPVNSRMSLP